MLELHDKPNDAWYARQLADGQIELNPADPEAEAKLERNHPTIAAALRLERNRKQALRKLRKVLRKVRAKLNAAEKKEVDDLIEEINGIEPDVAE